MNRFTIAALIVFSTASLVACAEQSVDVRIETGAYAGQAGETPVTVLIDREKLTALVASSASAAPLLFPITLAGRNEWSSGCADDAAGDHLEVWKLKTESLDLGTVHFSSPRLVAECTNRKPTATGIVLADETVNQCLEGAAKPCIHFNLRSATEAPTP